MYQKKIYQKKIREILALQGYIGKYNPRHIEGYMRLKHSCLDGLSKQDFISEVETCRQCIEQDGISSAESLAKSFGL